MKNIEVISNYGFENIDENIEYYIIGKDTNNVYHYIHYIEKGNFTENEFSIKNDSDIFNVKCLSNNLNEVIKHSNEYKEYLITKGYEVEDNEYGFEIIKIKDLDCLKNKFSN